MLRSYSLAAAAFVSVVSLVPACARRTAEVGVARLTSADFVQGYRESEAAAERVREGHFVDALADADHAATLAPDNPWARYNRAVALRGLGRTDAAVSAYRDAEARFASDRWGKSISIYGRARALADAGRCDEAKAAYEEYASFVRAFDAKGAETALVYAKECRPPPSSADPVLSDAMTAILAGRYADALALLDRASSTAKDSGWVDYNRAVALTGLHRFREAEDAYQAAETRLGAAGPRGREISVYGRARSLDMTGQCKEAKRAYEEYANLVRSTSPHDAAMATRIANMCAEH